MTACPIECVALEGLEQPVDVVCGHERSGVRHLEDRPVVLLDDDLDVTVSSVVVDRVFDEV